MHLINTMVSVTILSQFGTDGLFQEITTGPPFLILKGESSTGGEIIFKNAAHSLNTRFIVKMWNGIVQLLVEELLNDLVCDDMSIY